MSDDTERPATLDRGGTGHGRRNDLIVAGASLVWGLCFAGASQVIKREWLPAGPLPWLVAAVPSIAAIVLLAIYIRYLRQIDELHRLIQLQAMAMGFGGGFFTICGYLLFERLGAPTIDAATLAVVMPVLYAIGVIIGWRRYR